MPEYMRKSRIVCEALESARLRRPTREAERHRVAAGEYGHPLQTSHRCRPGGEAVKDAFTLAASSERRVAR